MPEIQTPNRAYHATALRRRGLIILRDVAYQAVRLAERVAFEDLEGLTAGAYEGKKFLVDPSALNVDVLMGTKTYSDGSSDVEWVRRQHALGWLARHPEWRAREVLFGSVRTGRYISVSAEPVEVPPGVSTDADVDALYDEMDKSAVILEDGLSIGKIRVPLLNGWPIAQALRASERSDHLSVVGSEAEVSPLDLIASTVQRISELEKI